MATEWIDCMYLALVAEFCEKKDIPKEICNIVDGTVYMPKEESIKSWSINVTRDSVSARWTLQVMYSTPAQPMVFLPLRDWEIGFVASNDEYVVLLLIRREIGDFVDFPIEGTKFPFSPFPLLNSKEDLSWLDPENLLEHPQPTSSKRVHQIIRYINTKVVRENQSRENQLANEPSNESGGSLSLEGSQTTQESTHRAFNTASRIMHAREIWLEYGKPAKLRKNSPGYRRNWDAFYSAALDILTSSETQTTSQACKLKKSGCELKVVMASDELYDKWVEIFKKHDKGLLINPETCKPYAGDAVKFEQENPLTHEIFRNLHGLSENEIITLTKHLLMETPGRTHKYPKVVIKRPRELSKLVSCYTVKEWSMRKKRKKIIVGELQKLMNPNTKQLYKNRQYIKLFKNRNEVNEEAWRSFKEKHGITSASMSLLIREAGIGWLGKKCQVGGRNLELPKEAKVFFQNFILQGKRAESASPSTNGKEKKASKSMPNVLFGEPSSLQDTLCEPAKIHVSHLVNCSTGRPTCSLTVEANEDVKLSALELQRIGSRAKQIGHTGTGEEDPIMFASDDEEEKLFNKMQRRF